MEKILITGGHPAPALAVIDRLQKDKKEISLVFVGRKYNNSRERSYSFEYQEVTRKNIRFIPLIAGRFTRVLSFQTFREFVLIPLGFIHALSILIREKPTRILTFGGYIGLPLAVVGWMLRIPVTAHEQTVVPGLANRIISRFAKNILISFRDSSRHFKKEKIVFTGNPVRESILKNQSHILPSHFSHPTIYVTGGSLGSHAINMKIFEIIEPLLSFACMVHQVGNIQEFADFELLQKKVATLPKNLQKKYIPLKHVSDIEIGELFHKADLVISRAGANTWFEIVALKKPAILIPLPWSSYNEQNIQARILKEKHCAEVFDQHDDAEKLLYLVKEMIHNKATYEVAYQKNPFDFPSDPTGAIVEALFS